MEGQGIQEPIKFCMNCSIITHCTHSNFSMDTYYLELNPPIFVPCKVICLDVTPLSMSYKHTLDVQSIFTPFLQDGSTALFYATQYGHTDLAQLLCESYGADVLHRTKVRAMHTASINRWWGELNCAYVHLIVIEGFY